jgi:cytochrome c-type biogenesis protein CcmH
MRLLVFVLMLFLALPALAVQPDEVLKDPALEGRARALSAELRCLVCQNQSIDDSDAPLARDLRLLIREHLTKGETDEQVMDFIVGRYGEFVLLKPRLEGRTLILWGSPFAILLLAALFLWRRRPPPPVAEQPLTEAERAELRRALETRGS